VTRIPHKTIKTNEELGTAQNICQHVANTAQEFLGYEPEYKGVSKSFQTELITK